MRCLAPVLIAALGATALAAEPPRANYKMQRAEEDWSFLRDDAAGRRDPWQAFKYLALSPTSPFWLSVGADARWRYESFNNPLWGAGLEDTNGYWLQRYFAHADLHLGEHVRVFAQVFSSLEDGRRGGPRPLDEDEADWHQLFAEVRVPLAGGDFHVRAGRQELSYGSSRLISIRESPNVRQTFDGVRAFQQWRDWQFDAFWMRSVAVDRASFDDESSDDEQLWGAYLTGRISPTIDLRADVYYFGLQRDGTTFLQGTADELRHSLGVRLSGRHRGWDTNLEAVAQFGEFGAADIRAWTVASDTGFTFAALPWRPRLGLKANITSGDDDPDDGRLETFNALYPRGAYFNELSLIGPYNHSDLSPSLTLQPTEDVTFTAQANFFWRTSEHDAVYNNGGDIARAPGASRERFVGRVLQTQLDWQVTANVSFSAVWARFFAGDFLRETGPAEDVNFVGAWIALRL